MSASTPSRIRSKTSDFTDFFRSNHTAGHSRSPANDLSTQSQMTAHSALDVPSNSTNYDSDATSRKKSTRLPFLGRQRKKSNPYASDSARESTEVGLSSRTASTDTRRPILEVTEIASSRRNSAHSAYFQPTPSLSSASPHKTLGSKLAAHFVPRVRKLSSLGPKPSSQPTADAVHLSPPHISKLPRDASLDSGSRSTTPQPAQSSMTLSANLEDLDEYKDLFTMPKPKKSPVAAESISIRDDTTESDATSSGGPSIAKGPPRRASAPNTVLEISRPKASRDSPPIRSSMKPPRKASPTERQGASAARGSETGSKSSSRSPSDKLSGPAIQRRQTMAPSTPAADYSAQQRLRMKQQASMAETAVPVPPPSMPLPPPPLSSPPSSPIIPPRTSSAVSGSSIRSVHKSRPRAGTGGSSNSAVNSPAPTRDEPRAEPAPAVQSIAIDLDSATAHQLKEALLNRNHQYDTLAGCFQKTTDKHMAEKAALEKKIAQLEQDMRKKDHQIKGLMWLLTNGKASSSTTELPPGLSIPPLPTAELEPPKVVSMSKLPFRRTQFSDDSGCESHPTSGAESLRSSETSGNESSSHRHRKLRRPFALGEGGYNVYRSSRTVPNSAAPVMALPELPIGNRTSVASSTASSLSSIPSLLPPSPSMTVSSLSSIPESPTASLRFSSSRRDMNEQEERRGVRASNRLSTSSSGTAASSTYAAKRSRPPSIAQVLEHTPEIKGVLDNARPHH